MKQLTDADIKFQIYKLELMIANLNQKVGELEWMIKNPPLNYAPE